jgi:site-specific recombinase XerD
MVWPHGQDLRSGEVIRPVEVSVACGTGKTTVLDAEQARLLLDSIDTSTVVGLRDRALISVMTFAFARIGAVVAGRAKS